MTEFVIRYEAFITWWWHSILRYDNAHGLPHRDLPHPDGSQVKEFFPDYSNAEIMMLGQRDIIENWQDYRATYQEEMER